MLWNTFTFPLCRVILLCAVIRFSLCRSIRLMSNSLREMLDVPLCLNSLQLQAPHLLLQCFQGCYHCCSNTGNIYIWFYMFGYIIWSSASNNSIHLCFQHQVLFDKAVGWCPAHLSSFFPVGVWPCSCTEVLTAYLEVGNNCQHNSV